MHKKKEAPASFFIEIPCGNGVVQYIIAAAGNANWSQRPQAAERKKTVLHSREAGNSKKRFNGHCI
jgi:hypothetical protein